MTNEQLTQKVIEMEAHQAKCDAEHERYEMMFREIQEDIRMTKNLAEDVHIMAINMQQLQKTQEDMSKKVDALTSKEFVEYKENKKAIKSQIISIIVGSVGTIILGFIGWLFMTFINKGGL